MFDNVKRVEFAERDRDRILAIRSKEGETVQLDKFVNAVGNVEEWLNCLLDMSHASLHTIIREAYNEINGHNFVPMAFLDNFVAQVRQHKIYIFTS